MTTKRENSIDWTVERRIHRMLPAELCDALRDGGVNDVRLFAEEGPSGMAWATWTASDGTEMEAIQFVERRDTGQQCLGAGVPTWATAIKPVGSGWEGYYTRVRFPSGVEYRYPAKEDERLHLIQLKSGRDSGWSAPRPRLSNTEIDAIYARTPFAIFGDTQTVWPPLTSKPTAAVTRLPDSDHKGCPA
jgi:hypothetical protein